MAMRSSLSKILETNAFVARSRSLFNPRFPDPGLSKICNQEMYHKYSYLNSIYTQGDVPKKATLFESILLPLVQNHQRNNSVHTMVVPAKKISLEEEESLRRLAEMQAGGALQAFVESQEERDEFLPTRRWMDLMEEKQENAVLVDNFGRKHNYLRISLTEKCNLRCQYCMPAEGIALGPDSSYLSNEEIIRLARLFVAEGVDKIRLTGGEPTVRKDLVSLVAALGQMPGLNTIALTTNAIVLARQLPALVESGLNALNISLDTLCPEKFITLTRRKGHDRVLNAIDRALELGVESVKVNVVLMRGINDNEIEDFVEWTRHKRINVRFIEYMPFDGNEWETKKMVPYKEMKRSIESGFGPLQRLNDPDTEVAKNYQIPGFEGSVSFITSMTEHFCDGCNRLRIMADGNLKVCLFGPAEVSLRDAMRAGASEDQLRRIVSAAVSRKKAGHDDPELIALTKNRPMIKIGG